MSVRATPMRPPRAPSGPPAAHSIPSHLTTAEFDELPDGATRRLEVYDNKAREKMSPQARHGRLQGNIHAALLLASQLTNAGTPYTEVHFRLSVEPHVRLVPDVAFVRADRAFPADDDNRVYQIAPDLAVEVLSPGDPAGEVFDKVAKYLTYGTQLVWVVDPATRSISVHAPDTTPVVLVESATIDAPRLLPGFSMRVGDLLDGKLATLLKPRARSRKRRS